MAVIIYIEGRFWQLCLPLRARAVSFAPELADEVREAAAESAGETISAWLADAAREKLRQRNLRRAIEAYEADHGEISSDEMAAIEEEWPV